MPEEAGEQLLLLSARSEAALEQATRNLANTSAPRRPRWRMLAFTLQKGRRSFAHRRFVVAGSASETADRLREPQARPVVTRHCEAAAADVVFLFPGAGDAVRRHGP